MFNRFDTIPACDRQTDRQTDILRQHSPRYGKMIQFQFMRHTRCLFSAAIG